MSRTRGETISCDRTGRRRSTHRRTLRLAKSNGLEAVRAPEPGSSALPASTTTISSRRLASNRSSTAPDVSIASMLSLPRVSPRYWTTAVRRRPTSPLPSGWTSSGSTRSLNAITRYEWEYRRQACTVQIWPTSGNRRTGRPWKNQLPDPRKLPLEEVRSAHETFCGGHVRGKVVFVPTGA